MLVVTYTEPTADGGVVIRNLPAEQVIADQRTRALYPEGEWGDRTALADFVSTHWASVIYVPLPRPAD